jgi:uncharacterized protein
MNVANSFTATFERTKVSFDSSGLQCAGYLYRPAGTIGHVPCVVMAHGFSGTMDWILPSFAERFAAAGLAVLIFDYRYFGESEGQPRQLVDVKRQRHDITAAIRFARTLEGIDPERIALWGTSLGGGHVIAIAADDPHIAAVVSQVPGIDMVNKRARATIKIPTMVLLKLLMAAVRDAIHGLFGLPPYYIKVFGKPGETAVFTDPTLQPRFDTMMRESRSWRNEFTPRFYLALPRYKHGTAERIKMPLLVCVADHDVYTSPTFHAWVATQAPRGEVRHYPAEHFDFYHGEMFEQVVRDQIDFLHTHLVDTSR